MIGPHEGKELDLMLSGAKKLAVFHDAIQENQRPPEAIIPEQTFAPYVDNGTFTRIEYLVRDAKNGLDILYVCFTPPDETWRAKAFLWIKEQTFNRKRQQDDADDITIGRLLGYSESDIADYTGKTCRETVNKQREMSRK